MSQPLRTRGIRRLATPRGIVMIIALTAMWCGLWQTVSWANIASGVALSVAILSSGVSTPATGKIRIDKLLQLLWIVFVDLVRSTFGLAKEIATPNDSTNEAIVAMHIPPEGRRHFLFLTIAITVTPGTAVVDADPDTGELYVHLLYADQQAEVTAHVENLTRLVCQALPAPAPTSIDASL